MQSKIREDIHDDDNDGFDYDSIYCNFNDNNDKNYQQKIFNITYPPK